MRDIKFRAWDEKRKEWIPNNLLFMDYDGQVLAGDIYNPPFTLINSKNVSLYTGLKDKNGREIFEGDIVLFCDFDSLRTGGNTKDTIQTQQVKFENTFFTVGNHFLYDALTNDEELEVIGNIYENPELLEVETCGK